MAGELNPSRKADPDLEDLLGKIIDMTVEGYATKVKVSVCRRDCITFRVVETNAHYWSMDFEREYRNIPSMRKLVDYVIQLLKEGKEKVNYDDFISAGLVSEFDGHYGYSGSCVLD